MAESEEETVIAQEECLPTSEGEDQRGGNEEVVEHWCYQCSKEVAVEAEEQAIEGEPSTGMVCTECRSGFVEAMATAQPDFHRVARRRRRRATSPHRLRLASLLDVLEHLYPQQLMHVLQALDQNTPLDTTEQEEHPSGVENANESEAVDQNLAVASAMEGSHVQEDAPLEPFLDSDSLAGRQESFSRELSYEQDEDAEGEGGQGGAGSEEEEAAFEFGGWDMAGDEDDEEWEEVEGDEEEDDDAEGTAIENTEEPSPESLPDPEAADRPSVARELRNFRFQGGNSEDNLHRYLQSFLQSLEVRLELPSSPLYVGNPGDYLDARGFESFLQQLAENDDSRRGAPPAAKAAVDDLAIIRIESHHMEDGMALCSICEDVFGVGDSAKQLPCSHFYHHDCIITWLATRNSCPMCRYELPTDDPDYETQKRREVRSQQAYEAANSAEEPLGREEGYLNLAQAQVSDSSQTAGVSASLPSLTSDLVPSTSSQSRSDQIQQNLKL